MRDDPSTRRLCGFDGGECREIRCMPSPRLLRLCLPNQERGENPRLVLLCLPKRERRRIRLRDCVDVRDGDAEVGACRLRGCCVCACRSGSAQKARGWCFCRCLLKRRGAPAENPPSARSAPPPPSKPEPDAREPSHRA